MLCTTGVSWFPKCQQCLTSYDFFLVQYKRILDIQFSVLGLVIFHKNMGVIVNGDAATLHQSSKALGLSLGLSICLEFFRFSGIPSFPFTSQMPTGVLAILFYV